MEQPWIYLSGPGGQGFTPETYKSEMKGFKSVCENQDKNLVPKERLNLAQDASPGYNMQLD